MKTRIFILFIYILLPAVSYSQTQDQDTTWTLEECINYALNKNVQVRKSYLVNSTNEIYTGQAKAARLPSLDASVRQNFGWNKLPDSKFMRVHRSFIVNLEKINTIERSRIVFGKVYIPVSEQYKEKFQEFPDKNFL